MSGLRDAGVRSRERMDGVMIWTIRCWGRKRLASAMVGGGGTNVVCQVEADFRVPARSKKVSIIVALIWALALATNKQEWGYLCGTILCKMFYVINTLSATWHSLSVLRVSFITEFHSKVNQLVSNCYGPFIMTRELLIIVSAYQ